MAIRFAGELLNADAIGTITEIETKGEPVGGSGQGGGGNDGGSSVWCFHKAVTLYPARHYAERLPSHLILLGDTA